MYAPSIDSDITVTLSGPVASELIARAGLGDQDYACWHLRNGRTTTDPKRALTDALVKIAEDEV
jgi:hypothetical protein